MLQFENFLTESKESDFLKAKDVEGCSSGDAGVVHELLYGFYVRQYVKTGKWTLVNPAKPEYRQYHMEKHPNSDNIPPRGAYIMKMRCFDSKQLATLADRAMFAAQEMVNFLEQKGYKIKDMHWTSKVGDITRTTGVEIKNQKDQDDDGVFTCEREDGTTIYCGVSHKAYIDNTDSIFTSYSGMEA